MSNRVWQAFVAVTTTDQIAKERTILKAKYAICAQTSLSIKKLPDMSEQHTFASCGPSRRSPAVAYGTEELPPTPPVVTRTEFHANTKTIKLTFGEEIFAGEPDFCKYARKTIKHLCIRKRLCYHIITNSSNDIIHVSKSKTSAENLPDRVVQKNPLVICNDIHYIIAYVKCLWFESIEVTKRTSKEQTFFEQVDLSKIIWPLSGTATAILIYAALNLSNLFRKN